MQQRRTINRVKKFRKGSKRYKKKISPSHEQLARDSAREAGTSTREREQSQLHADAEAVHEAQQQEQVEVSELLDRLEEGGHGDVPDRKPSGVVRWYGENVNHWSLYDTDKEWKRTRVNNALQRIQADGASIVEGGTDWRQVPEGKKFSDIVGGRDNKRSVAANNTTESSGRTQAGGAASVLLSRLAGFHLGSGEDTTGLGRWVWQLVGSGSTRTRIVTAYQPTRPQRRCSGNNRRGYATVWAQHRRYFRKRGIFDTPRRMWQDQLAKQLVEWKLAGDEIILFADVNGNVYTGNFATRLMAGDLIMTEQFAAANGYQAPASHFRGRTPITGCFATQGIDCLAAYNSPHQKGAGDHRYWILDFCARSILGTDYPRLVRPRSRKLRCTVERTRKKYNVVLLNLSFTQSTTL